MKIAYRLLFVLLLSFFFFGCGDKTAGVEGKIVDGKGKPISGVSMIFKQVQPTQGYEQFETKTGADGIFRLTGLAPISEYNITILSDKWSTKVTKKIKTLEGGQSLGLASPIKIRYTQMKDGTIIDTKTGLQWFIHPASDVTAGNVKLTVQGLNIGGFADWRLPSREELASLHEEKVAAKPSAEPVLINKTCCAWVLDATAQEGVDWKFYVEDDNELWLSSKDSPDNRIVVVRDSVAVPVAASSLPDASSAPAVDQPATSQTQPAVATPAGVKYASRKACAEKKAQAGKLTKATSSPTPSVNVPVPAASKSAAAPSPVAAPVAKVAEPAKSAPAVNTEALSTAVYFDTGSSALKAQEIAKLKSFLTKIKGKKGSLVIDGHADTTGSSNLMISFDRSYRVVSALNKMGVSKNIKIELKALGDAAPAATNETADGRKLNRRVDINFIEE